jgi:glycosyltransferase involved in cell wall biosynthesis
MCASRALLTAMPAENLAARIVQESGAGVTVEPDDTAGFCAAARRLIQDDSGRAGHARGAHAYATQHFDIDRIANRFENVVTAARGARRRH